MNENLKDQDILLVKEKDSNELQAASMDKDNKVSRVKPDNAENPDFLRINNGSNALENFFENFMRQAKEPTRFEFFRVPAEKFQEVMQKLQEAFKNPDKPENKEFIEQHRVDPDTILKKQTQTQGQGQPQAQNQKEYAINPDQVDWKKFEDYGISRQYLEYKGKDDKMSNLEKLLDYRKTDLVPVSLKLNDASHPTSARFSLRKQEDGTFAPHPHFIRHKPDLERPYFGVQFTEEDKKNFLTTGNLGRVVEAEFKPGEKTPIILSLDKQTNELVAYRKEWLKVPDTYKGVQLNEEQKRELGEGKAVKVDNMISQEGKPFSREVQFNADKRYFELIFNNDKKQEQRQTQGNIQNDVPTTFRKKELTEDQRDSLREGKTVYTGDLLDKKGQKYSGYITLNKETGKLDFMFPKDYKEALAAEKVIPDNRHKPQVAKNNKGETTETNKHVNEPFKSGQTQPTETQQQEKEKKQVKPTGRKMS